MQGNGAAAAAAARMLLASALQGGDESARSDSRRRARSSSRDYDGNWKGEPHEPLQPHPPHNTNTALLQVTCLNRFFTLQLNVLCMHLTMMLQGLPTLVLSDPMSVLGTASTTPLTHLLV